MAERPAPPPPPRRATIADVAERAGVSRGAVSKVFNGTGRISPATAARIRAAAAALSWSPSASAVALRRSQARAVGLVMNPTIGATNSLLIEGVESVLSPLQYGLLLYLAEPHAEGSEKVYRMLADAQRADGVLLVDASVGDTRFELLRSLGLPGVLVGTPPEGDPVPFVEADPAWAGVPESVELLARLGHRRLAFVGGPPERVQALMRRRAFQDACHRHGVRPVATIAGPYSEAHAAEHTGRLLTGPDRPTGILYSTDSMAMAGLLTARRLGLDVPGDVSVIGYDGLPIGEWTEPQLTTVQRDRRQRGRAAAAMLMRMLGEDVEEEEVPRPYLVVRGSTGPAPAS